MKLPAFFSHREGLPIADGLPVPPYIHQPLKRVGVLCLCIVLLSTVIGAAALLLLEGLLGLEHFATNIVPGIALAALIVAGALAAGWLWKKTGWWKPLSQLVYSVTGMPLGPEGILLKVAVLLRLGRSFSSAEKDVLAVSAIAAGIAAWFGTPLAAAVMVWFSITRRRTGYVLLAAFTGAALHYAWFGPRSLGPFEMPGAAATGVYILLGLLMGILSGLIVRAVQALNMFSGRYLSIAAVALIAVLVCLKPLLFGPGIGLGRQALTLENVTLSLLINIASYKLITLIAAAGARFPGSLLTPFAAVGAASGVLTALWLQSLFSTVPLNPSLAAVVGMAAMLGGVTRLPLMAALFALEISWQPAAIAPVALASLAAYAASTVFLRRL
ncbi:chloride channel protein [Chitinophaga sp. GCM10012297]|uniref:Chloride channel protein n=1 Tax=Chitinophaga chungangae TaxID=2821488 RepID=A0ABS3YEQ7_9BACT|nr:chloride channel protein [Chitinophaga chungangae]MBO9153139.1 chloride channel protein [Chitinophaga chungangae]